MTTCSKKGSKKVTCLGGNEADVDFGRSTSSKFTPGFYKSRSTHQFYIRSYKGISPLPTSNKVLVLEDPLGPFYKSFTLSLDTQFLSFDSRSSILSLFLATAAQKSFMTVQSPVSRCYHDVSIMVLNALCSNSLSRTRNVYLLRYQCFSLLCQLQVHLNNMSSR